MGTKAYYKGILGGFHSRVRFMGTVAFYSRVPRRRDTDPSQ